MRGNKAVAVMRGNGLAPHLNGMVWLCDTPRGVCINACINGLPASETGFYGFHIHERGVCSPAGFSGAGGHYNPGGTPHPLHAGDLPMLMADGCGGARLCFVTPRFTVRDVIGRSIIIHGGCDDYTSQPGGDAGPRIGCGVIKGV